MFCLTLPTDERHLPLSAWAAEYVAGRLAGVNKPARATRRLLLLDPALSLWCLAQSDWGAPDVCLDDLGRWLDQQSTETLRASLIVESSDAFPRSLKRMARSSLRSAIERADRIRECYDQPSALRALLHNCHQWFGVDKASIDDLPLPRALLGKIRKKRRTDKRRRKRVALPRNLRLAVSNCWRAELSSPWPLVLFELLRPAPVPNVSDTTPPADAAIDSPDDKLEALKELAYGASHEINNPLANISTRAQLLMAQAHGPELQRHFAAINQQAFRAHEMIADLMLFANPPELDAQHCQLNTMIQDVVAEYRDTLTPDAALLFHEDLKPTVVLGDAAQLAVAIQALIRNSAEAMQFHGAIWVSCRTTGDDNGAQPEARVVIRDNGPGMDDRAQAHLFDPFFSGREAGRGLGFGLSKAWRIAKLHGGTIGASFPEGGGTQFEIRIPTGPASKNSAALART